MLVANLRAAYRATVFFAVTGFLVFVVAPLFNGPRARQALRRFWSRFCCRLLGLRVMKVRGSPCTTRPTLLIPNHVSYVDVMVLGCFLDATFTAKSDVEGWPFFGHVVKVSGTMFLKRHWRQALIQRNAIAARMRAGESFVVFAEGTSSNGLGVRPFKTSLLSVVEPGIVDRPVAAQAVTLAFLRLADGTPISTANCDHYAWYDDMEFVPHLWALLKQRGVEIELEFHAPVLSETGVSRKVLGPALRAEIAARLAALRGDAAADAAAKPNAVPAADAGRLAQSGAG